MTDGYADYDQVPRATCCGCWTYMYRKWREVMPRGATASTSNAAIGYKYCNKLFALERKYKVYSPKQRQEIRQAQTEPVLDAYWPWVEKIDPEPGSNLEDAVR